MTHGVCELLWIKQVIQDLRIDYGTSVGLHCDNKTAIEIAHNLVQHDRTKHVEIDRHFIKENLDRKIIQLSFVRSEDQLAIFSQRQSLEGRSMMLLTSWE